MAAQDRVHGKNSRLILAVGGTGAGLVVSLNKFTLDQSTQRIDVTCFEDLNEVKLQGRAARKVSWSGFWDTADDTMFRASESLVGNLAYFYPNYVGKPSQYMYGLAWVDASVDSSSTDAVKTSGTMEAAGSWGRVF